MAYTAAYVLAMFVVCQCAGCFSYSPELVCSEVAVVYGFFYLVYMARFAWRLQFEQYHLAFESVENDEVFI